jgi:hypothetical protein
MHSSPKRVDQHVFAPGSIQVVETREETAATSSSLDPSDLSALQAAGQRFRAQVRRVLSWAGELATAVSGCSGPSSMLARRVPTCSC